MQIDYLKLITTGRKSIYYARPSDADDALTGMAGICFVLSLALIFVVAISASYFGKAMSGEMLGWPLAATILPGIALFRVRHVYRRCSETDPLLHIARQRNGTCDTQLLGIHRESE